MCPYPSEWWASQLPTTPRSLRTFLDSACDLLLRCCQCTCDLSAGDRLACRGIRKQGGHCCTDQLFELALTGNLGQWRRTVAQHVLDHQDVGCLERGVAVGIGNGWQRTVGLVQHLLLGRARHELDELNRCVLAVSYTH